MKRRKLITIVSLILVCSMALLFAGCGNGSTTESTAPEANTPESKEPVQNLEPIKIGLLNESSGAYEVWGQQELRGFMVGLMYATDGTMEIDGRPIEVIVEDTTGDVGVAVQKATKLMEDDKVDILSGSNLSSIALAVMDKAAELEIPYVINGAASDDICGANFNEYTFRIGRNLWMASTTGLSYLDSIRPEGVEGTTWVVLSPDYAGGRAGGEALRATLEELGGIVLDEIYAPLDCADFTPYIQKIKELNPMFLTATLVGNNYTAKLPQQLQELGALETTVLTCSIVDFDFFATIGQNGIGMEGECIYNYNLFDTPANTYFIEKHQEMYNGDYPDYWAGQSFAGAQAIVEALKKAGSTDARDFIGAMEGLEYESVKGTMIIRAEDHQALQNMAVARVIDDGKGGVTVELAHMVELEDLIPPIKVTR